MRDDDVKLLTIGCIAFIVVLLILLILFRVVPQPSAHAASPLSVVAAGRVAHISWHQPPDADTAIVLRQRQPQLVEALKFIAGPQQAVDDETAPGDVYWIDFWNDNSYVETSGLAVVRWEQRLIFP